MNFLRNERTGAAEGFCLIKTCEVKKTAKGLPYLDLILADSDGEISAKYWDYNPELQGAYNANELIKVRGTISLFNGADQLRIERIRKCLPSDNVRIEDFVPSADYASDVMFEELLSIASSMYDETYRGITLAILNERKEKLLYWPAAFKLHHAVRGGLLMHTLSMVRLCENAVKIYDYVNSDLLLAGAILHDIGKIGEFNVPETGLASGYTTDGTLIGHLVRGAMLVEKTAEKLGVKETEKVMLLEHLILSHHGEPEFGAAVRPMCIEAELLSMIDTLDAKMFEMAAAVASAPEKDFSQRQWALDNRKFYNPGGEIKPKAKLF